MDSEYQKLQELVEDYSNEVIDVPTYEELRKAFFLMFNAGFNHGQCDNPAFVYRLHERLINLSKFLEQKKDSK